MQHYFVRQFIVFILGFLVCTTLHAQPLEQIAIEKSMPPKSYPIHGSDLLWKQELEVRKFVAEHPEALKSNTLRKTAWTFTVGSTKSWYADNLITHNNSDRYQVPSTCRAVGINCYIFVEDSSWNTHVNQAAVDSIRIYFDSKTPANPSKGIFATDTSAFGNPPDVDHDPKIIILLLNIKDGYSGSGGFVEGYFYSFNEVNPSQPGYSTSNFAEMFYIDTNPLNLATPGGLASGISTLAHEFQHMIHFNYASLINGKSGGDLTFIDEGCSVLAEVNCGFPIYNPVLYANEPNHYLLDWRPDDMTAVLNDYSRAARFFVYMRDQVGMSLFKNIVASPLYGVPQIDAGFQAIASSFRFADILKNWFVANILDDRSINPLYGYIYPGLPKSHGRLYFNPTVTLTTDTVQNYAVQYLDFKSGSQLRTTITCSNSALLVKAVEIGPSSKRVLDVTNGVEFYEPEFGTTYSEVHFVIMNTSPNTQYTYTYAASGISSGVVELKYDLTEPTGYLSGAIGDTVCVWFNGVTGGKLDSVRVALRRAGMMTGGVWTYTGVVQPSPLGAPLAVPVTATVTQTPSYPYPVPWPNWGTIDLRTKNIDASKAFAVAFIDQGDYTTQPRVMITESSLPSEITSLTYSNASSSPNWYYPTSNDAGDSVFTYLIRAYVSIDTSGEKQNIELTPASFILAQNYPNPFNPSTTIKFQIPSKGFVTLKIYDIIGREVATLVNGFQEAGNYTVQWSAANLSSGVYWYRLTAGTFVQTNKMLLLK
ncbi:MAG: T9SS type A sorting domain-containing protein [Bacteroidota bacterium]|jgi:hypothetical protein